MTARNIAKAQAFMLFGAAIAAAVAIALMSIGLGTGAVGVVGGLLLIGLVRLITLPKDSP